MNQNLAGMFSIKIAHFIPIRYQHGRHGQFVFLVGPFLKSPPLKPLGQIKWNVTGSIYGRSSIRFLILSRLDKNMVAISNSSFWLVENKKKKLLTATMNCHFVRFIYGMPCTKFPYGHHRQFCLWLDNLENLL
jgi:hypothetical protein